MEQRMQIDETVSVGQQPSREEFAELEKEGFRSVINVREAGEEDQPLAPDEEETVVRELGLEYRHVPVSAETMDEERVNRFREILEEVRNPAFVHCRRGKRSGALVMMDRAVKQGLSGDETLEKAEEMGFECDVERLNQFVREYVDSHSNS